MIERLFKKNKEMEEEVINDVVTKKERNNNQIIGVWGSSGSGKTTTSIKIAENLASKGFNIIVVFTDVTSPVIPTLIRDSSKDREKSIGKVLLGNIEQKTIQNNLVTLEKNDNIAMLGYAKNENFKSYPDYVEEIVEDLLLHLRHLADYIIIDLGYIITDIIINDTILKKSDFILKLSTADLRGLSFHSSNLPLYKTNKELTVVSNIMPYQAKETINDVLKASSIYLDNIEEILNQTSEQRLFEPLVTKESKVYKENLEKIVEVIMYGD